MTGPAVPPGGEGHTHPGDGQVGGVLVPEFGCPACDLAMRSAAIPPGGEELRIARWLFDKVTRRDGLIEVKWEHLHYEEQQAGWLGWAGELLALPEMREALAAQEKVRRVEELAHSWEHPLLPDHHWYADRVRRALDGES